MDSDTTNNGGGQVNAGMSGDGTVQRPSWMSSLPDDLKQNDVLSQFSTIGDAGKALVSLKGFEGKAITIPGENATDAERAEFFNKLGRPENADGYGITKPSDLPEGIDYDPAIEQAFSKFAHDNGFSKAQAAKTFDWYYGLVKSAATQQAKATEEAITTLKSDWGPKFDENKEIAVRAFKTIGKGFESILDEARIGSVKLGDHPSFVKLFHAIGTKIIDDKASFDGSGVTGADTIEAQERQQASKMFPSMTPK